MKMTAKKFLITAYLGFFSFGLRSQAVTGRLIICGSAVLQNIRRRTRSVSTISPELTGFGWLVSS